MKRANGESQADGPAEKCIRIGGATHQSSQTFRVDLVIDNLSEHIRDKKDVVVGPIVIVGNSTWSLRAQVEKKDGSDFLHIYLKCQSPGAGWRLKTDYTASVVGSNVQKVERRVKVGEGSHDLCVFSKEKQELLDAANDYVTDGTFKMDVEVTIYEPYRMLVDFFSADSNYDADVVLRVQERRFYVNKAYLGHESPFFHQLFFGPFAESSREEVPLEDVDADELLQFLGAIHRMRAPITADNAEILVMLADRFEVDWLLGDCEAYLLRTKRFTVVKKLIISTKVNLDELQKKCLDDLTLKDVDKLIGLGKERAMGVKLNGCLLQDLLDKQKDLMEDEFEDEMDSLKAKMCLRCRNKLS